VPALRAVLTSGLVARYEIPDLLVTPLAPASRTRSCGGHAGCDRYEQERTEGADGFFDREWADVGDHWKISVVQSPPWRRTSCARAGPLGRSWKSTKNSVSISMPPSGKQFTRVNQERRPG
jgi:hypothetical protein